MRNRSTSSNKTMTKEEIEFYKLLSSFIFNDKKDISRNNKR